jgi:hypothetical protein
MIAGVAAPWGFRGSWLDEIRFPMYGMSTLQAYRPCTVARTVGQRTDRASLGFGLATLDARSVFSSPLDSSFD